MTSSESSDVLEDQRLESPGSTRASNSHLEDWKRDSISSSGTFRSSADLETATILTAEPVARPKTPEQQHQESTLTTPPQQTTHDERPISLQSVALTDASDDSEPLETRQTSLRHKKPSALKLAASSEEEEDSLQSIADVDLNDLETVPPSTATLSQSSSQHALHTAFHSPSSGSSQTLGSADASTSVKHRSQNQSGFATRQPSTPTSGKVSSLRSRFEQASPVNSAAAGSPKGSPELGSPISPNSSGSRRRSIQMIQANFQRKKLEMQQSPNSIGADRNSKQKRTSDVPIDGDESTKDNIDWDFWGSVVADYSAVAKEQPKQLSRAIQEGIPPALRGLLWQLMSSSKDTALEELYSSLLKLPSSHEKAIQRDITRTFPHHKYFQDGEAVGGGAGQENLFNVVKCYSLFDEEVGYCQGLQFLVGPLLLNMPDEEAFCVLVRLMQSYGLRTHYTPHMPGLQMRLFQFDKLLEELLPVTFLHLTRQGVKSSMYASQWWLTLFGYRFPLELVHTIMDLILAEGVEAVFRFSISLMQYNEEAILKLEFEDLVEFLKNHIYERWQKPNTSDTDEQYDAKRFVKDALSVRIAPSLLDQYASEWTAMIKEQDAHNTEVEGLRRVNAQLSLQVRHLEGSLAQINQEHCDLIKQVVQARLEKEALEEELVRYKLQCAELAHRRDSASATNPPPTPPPLPSTLPIKPQPAPSMAAAATSFLGTIRPSWGRKEASPTPQPDYPNSTASSFTSNKSGSSEASAGAPSV